MGSAESVQKDGIVGGGRVGARHRTGVSNMFKKTLLAATAAATLALPSVAQANHRDGYSDYGRYEDRYDQRDYDRRYNDGYYGRTHRDDYRSDRRCKGTTGTVVGGAAGAVVGRAVTRDRYRGRSGITGTIIGGALGALAGRAVDKSSCRSDRYYR